MRRLALAVVLVVCLAVCGVPGPSAGPGEAAAADRAGAASSLLPQTVEDILRALGIIVKVGTQTGVAQTVEAVAATVRERPSQAAVHDALWDLYRQDFAGKLVAQTVCTSMSATSDGSLTLSGDSWRSFTRSTLLRIALSPSVTLTQYRRWYETAKTKLERLNTTWNVGQVSPGLARWYWNACLRR